MAENTIAERVRDTIYRASLCLDEGRWEEWLALCDEEFYYAIRAFSPEINVDMTYLDGKRAELVTLTEMLPKHNSDHSPLARHTVVYTVTLMRTVVQHQPYPPSPFLRLNSTELTPMSLQVSQTCFWSVSTETGSVSPPANRFF